MHWADPGGEPKSPKLPAGSVQVGRFMLEIGAPAGTKVLDAEEKEEDNLRALGGALKEDKAEAPEPRTGGLADAATELVDEASEVTSKFEDAVGLFNQVAEGLDPKALSGEVPMLLDLLEQLDRERRWSEALRLARALSGLLALLMRWIELVRSLQTALRLAEKLGDRRTIGWAVHELGTLHLGAERPSAAERRLGQAREIRQAARDQDGLAMTEHNLQALCRLTNRLMRERRLVERNTLFQRLRYSPAFIAALAVVLLAGGAIAGAVVSGSGGGDDAKGGGGNQGGNGGGQVVNGGGGQGGNGGGQVVDADGDGDGVSPPDDCNDRDDSIYPGAAEIADDGVDQDCDGEDPPVDADGDGVSPPDDCNDRDDSVYPGAAEIDDDGVDQDCDGFDPES